MRSPLLFLLFLSSAAAQQERPTPAPVHPEDVVPSPFFGRTLLDAISDQPGWIYEQNSVLHPRESEYQTLFVIDGISRTDNLSPGFQFTPTTLDERSVQTLTAGYPAKYGRNLGGVVLLNHAKEDRYGLHGLLGAGAGYGYAGEGNLSYESKRNEVDGTGEAYRTSRYLDPPTFSNFHNSATAQSTSISDYLTIDSDNDLEVHAGQNLVNFDVPNEVSQQQVGQDQRRHTSSIYANEKISARFEDFLLQSSAGVVINSARLISNELSTPILTNQDRGFSQYSGGLTATQYDHGRNAWNAGVDILTRYVHERLNYAIKDPTFFPSDIAPQFSFNGKRWDVEPAAYGEDVYAYHSWRVSAGLRFDSYSFNTHAQAFSPRVSITRYLEPLHSVLHVSYDRVFNAPPVENLLLASDSVSTQISPDVQQTPVRPGGANFYEAGVTSDFTRNLSFSFNEFVRHWHNFYDDDQFLNTGVSFPFNDRAARIHGSELSLRYATERLRATVNYTNQNGTAYGPIVGGLLLGAEAEEEHFNTSSFPTSQDQRNKVFGSARYALSSYLTLLLEEQYNSGLPAEIDPGVTHNSLEAQYGPRIVDHISLSRDRVKPWSRLDLGLLFTPTHLVDVSLVANNALNQSYLINFAGLFSGTAVGIDRRYRANLTVHF